MLVDSERFQQWLKGFRDENGQWRRTSTHLFGESVQQRWGQTEKDYVQYQVVDWRGDEKCLLSNN